MAEQNELTGQTLQGYHIQKPIGQGKFSIVYRAETTNNTIVALKKIKIFDILDPKQREKCLKEVKLMQPLDHPNIIKYIDSFIHNNELIIITEWAEKGDLKKMIKNAIQEDVPFEEIKIWEYSMQISGALKQMHEKRIMHRDLKPANIFISQDGNLKVGDLGLGRIFSSETIEAYSKVGTPLYMSPELLRGEGYDMKSDVWSLGCVLYELCELRSPFRNENEKMSLMDLFNKITKGEFKPISSKYSDELRKLINNMIIIDPQHRCDMNTVCQISEQMFNYLKKTPKVDGILVMEDIYEKLGILQYHNYFCKPLKKKPVSKLCFAINEKEMDNDEKFRYFTALCYWILNLSKYTDKLQAVYANNVKEAFNLQRSNEEIANKLISDLKSSGIRLGEQMNISYFTSGYGDMNCFLLNDLLNRELVRLNYKFDPPNFSSKLSEEEKNNSYIEEEGENDGKQLDLINKYNLSDEENALPTKKVAVKSALFHNNNNNNSRFTSATTRADEMENKKEEVEENDAKKMILETNVEPTAWKTEMERVSSRLEEFDNIIQREPEKILKSNQEDFRHFFKEISLSSLKFKDDLSNIKKNGIEKFIDKLSDDIQNIDFGENIINKFSSDSFVNFKEMMHLQKSLFEDLSKKTQNMKNKISEFEEINNKLLITKEKLSQKVEFLDGNKEILKIQETTKLLKKEIMAMNIKQSLIEKKLFKPRDKTQIQKI